MSMPAARGGEPQPRPIAQLLIELVRAAEEGDRARFDRLFDACLPQVYGITWRILRDRQRAEAAAAEILLGAATRDR